MNHLNDQLSDANDRACALDNELTALKDAKSATEATLATTNEALAAVRAEVDSMKNVTGDELSHLQKKLDAVEEEKHAQETQLKDYVERLRTTEEKLTSMKAEKKKLKDSATAKNKELTQLRERVKALGSESNDEVKRVLSQLAELQELQKTTVAERDAANASKVDLEQRLTTLESEREGLMSSASKANTMAARLSELETEIATVRANEEKTLTEMSDLADTNNALIDKLTEELEAVRASGDADAQRRVGELNATLGEAQYEAASLRNALDEARASIASMSELQARVATAEANLATANEVQKDLSAKLSEANAALARQQNAPPSTPPPSSASRRIPRTPSEHSTPSVSIIDIESGEKDRAESPSKTMRMWRDSRVTGRVPKSVQPAMDVCDRAFVRFFRVMRTQPALRFAALSYWALIHAWLFLRFVL